MRRINESGLIPTESELQDILDSWSIDSDLEFKRSGTEKRCAANEEDKYISSHKIKTGSSKSKPNTYRENYCPVSDTNLFRFSNGIRQNRIRWCKTFDSYRAVLLYYKLMCNIVDSSFTDVDNFAPGRSDDETRVNYYFQIRDILIKEYKRVASKYDKDDAYFHMFSEGYTLETFRRALIGVFRLDRNIYSYGKYFIRYNFYETISEERYEYVDPCPYARYISAADNAIGLNDEINRLEKDLKEAQYYRDSYKKEAGQYKLCYSEEKIRADEEKTRANELAKRLKESNIANGALKRRITTLENKLSVAASLSDLKDVAEEPITVRKFNVLLNRFSQQILSNKETEKKLADKTKEVRSLKDEIIRLKGTILDLEHKLSEAQLYSSDGSN